MLLAARLPIVRRAGRSARGDGGRRGGL
jgi:hypothetical protein